MKKKIVCYSILCVAIASILLNFQDLLPSVSIQTSVKWCNFSVGNNASKFNKKVDFY